MRLQCSCPFERKGGYRGGPTWGFSETKKAINVLMRRSGKQPKFPDETPERIATLRIRPDQFYGRPLTTSVQEFLEQRKKATGEQACDSVIVRAGFLEGTTRRGALQRRDEIALI